MSSRSGGTQPEHLDRHGDAAGTANNLGHTGQRVG
jgi:hypothetical protein